MPSHRFQNYIGIDYSGAATPQQGLTGIRVYLATPEQEAREIRPCADPRRHWSRAALHAWLAPALVDGGPTLVGIDHGFSFPEEYFQAHGLPREWRLFLEDFHRHWPTDEPTATVESLRRGAPGRGQ